MKIAIISIVLILSAVLSCVNSPEQNMSYPSQLESQQLVENPPFMQFFPQDFGYSGVGDEFKATEDTRLYLKPESTYRDEEGNIQYSYGIIVEGVPENEVYELWYKNLKVLKPDKLSFDVCVDNTGLLINCKDSTGITINFFNQATGEATMLALQSKDKDTNACVKIIPNPNEVTMGRYHLWVEIVTSRHNCFCVYGEGFESNEELNYELLSYTEELKANVKADDNGQFSVVLLPAVIGYESGQAMCTVIGKYGSISIEFTWKV